MSSKTQQRQQVYTTQTFANHDEHFNDCQVDPLAAISLEHIFTTTPNSLIVTPTEEDVPSDAIPALRNPAYANLQSFLTTSLMLPSDADHFASSHPAAQLTRLTDLSPNLYVDAQTTILNVYQQAAVFQHESLSKFDGLAHDLVQFCTKMLSDAGPKGLLAKQIELIKAEMDQNKKGSPALVRGAVGVKSSFQRLASASQTIVDDCTALLNDLNHFHGLTIGNHVSLSHLYDRVFTNDDHPDKPSIAQAVQGDVANLRETAVAYAQLYQAKRDSYRVSAILTAKTIPIGTIIPFGTLAQPAVGLEEAKPMLRARHAYLSAQQELMQKDPTQGPIFQFFDVITQTKVEMSELHATVDSLLKVVRALLSIFTQLTTEFKQLADETLDAALHLVEDDAFCHTLVGVDLEAGYKRYEQVKSLYLNFVSAPTLDWVTINA